LTFDRFLSSFQVTPTPALSLCRFGGRRVHCVTTSATVVTSSRAQREPASLGRIATLSSSVTGVVNEADRPAEKGSFVGAVPNPLVSLSRAVSSV
jgi:hypothetical protein